MEFGVGKLLEEAVNSVKDQEHKELIADDERNRNLLSLYDLELNDLSPRTNELLAKMALYKKVCSLRSLDTMSVYCWYSDLVMEKMEYEPIILKLEQNIKDITWDIEKYKKQLDLFKEDLASEKKKSTEKSDSDDYMKKKCSLENKISNYDAKLKELLIKLSNSKIPSEILPANIKNVEEEIQHTKAKRDELKNMVDKLALARSAKKDLFNLRERSLNTPLRF